MSLILQGSTSGSVTLQEPAVAGTTVLDLPATSGTLFVTGQSSAITSGTAVASTSGTSIDFTSIPSWVKRVTVNLNGVSWNSTVGPLIQLGDNGGVETTGYSSIAGSSSTTSGAGAATQTSGFGFQSGWDSGVLFSGSTVFSLLDASTNTWVGQGILYADSSTTDYAVSMAGVKSLSATLDRVRITSTAAITFDAGSINILYE
jgi:hypothetical protein